MKQLFFLFVIVWLPVGAQTSVTLSNKHSTPLEADVLIGVNKFDGIYYVTNNTFYKKTNQNTVNYSNFQLGSIASASVFNPLKLLLFFKNFNAVVLLDNRLSEILRIDFNTVQPYINSQFVSLGNDNTLWVFNLDNQQLTLYDYRIKTTRATTLPVASSVLDLTSNYNNAWLLTENYIYKYTYFGSMLYKIPNTGFSAMALYQDNLILQKTNELFFLNDATHTITPINLPNLLINQFLVTGETLYIYDSKMLHEFQLKK
ncbi:hypothetical protein ACFSQP_09155 [Bizionia sediminis]|uniref:Uncharacterized protein n=1 Tax=Bizionia sediminis TaxID=1737064 RepID=A0ABW5KWK3_9FLAO